MKRFFLAVLMACLIGLSADAKIMNANIKVKQLPQGTLMKLEMIDPIGAPSSTVGDIFTAILTEDIKIDGIMLLPRGSMVRGNIVKVVPNLRLSRTAILYINLDHIVTPTGKQLQINAGLAGGAMDLTLDGGIMNGGNYGYAVQQNWVNTTKIVSKSTTWGLESGDVARWFLTPVGAIFGTIGGGAYLVGDTVCDLFKKGGAVVIHQGSPITIMLLKPIDVPVN